MSGLSRANMQRLTAQEHLTQSIEDILSTPIGTRVLMREYGSDLPQLIDRPLNGETVVDVFMATAEALERWEPRFSISRIQLEDTKRGQAVVMIEGLYIDQTITVAAAIGEASA